MRRSLGWEPYIIVAGFLIAASTLHFAQFTWSWESPHFYSVIDGLGGGVSLFLGFVLYLLRPYRSEGDSLLIPALAFAVIGEAEIIGLVTLDPHLSAWIDCQSVLLGSILLLAVWLPRPMVRRFVVQRRVQFATLLLGVVIPIAILVYGGLLPLSVSGRLYAATVRNITLLSGVLYLLCLPRLIQITPQSELRLIVTMTLFLGLSALSFPLFQMWGVRWWLLQLAQFFPYVFAIGYLIKSFLLNQRTLFESEARFRTLFNEAPLGIGVVANSRYTFSQANPALSKMLGYTEEELLKLNLKLLLHPDEIYASFDERNQLLRGETSQYTAERRYLTKDNRMLWLKVHGALFQNGKKRGQEFRVIEDVTQDKFDQQKIQELADNLKRANTELERFAAVASHDLKSPLNTISNYVQLVSRRLKKNQDPETEAYLASVVHACRRLRGLVDDLLHYAHATKSAIHFETVDCAAVVQEVLGNLKGEIEASGAKVSLPTMPLIQGDKTQLSQLFQNLVENALKYRSETAPEVQIEVEDQEEDLLFSVRDNGIGFGMEHSEKIFGAFERLHSQDTVGTGLGLPICKSIVMRHGGRIWAKSQPGEGATFYFTLPKTVSA